MSIKYPKLRFEDNQLCSYEIFITLRGIMKGNPKAIEALNEVLKAKISAFNQYLCMPKCVKTGVTFPCMSLMRKTSIEEMKHAEKLLERMLCLEGIP